MLDTTPTQPRSPRKGRTMGSPIKSARWGLVLSSRGLSTVTPPLLGEVSPRAERAGDGGVRCDDVTDEALYPSDPACGGPPPLRGEELESAGSDDSSARPFRIGEGTHLRTSTVCPARSRPRGLGAGVSFKSLLAHCSLLTTHYSLLTTHYSLLTPHPPPPMSQPSRLVLRQVLRYGHSPYD